MPNNQQQLDPQLVDLAKALRQTESGGNFNAQGKSGEYGAYQFMPTTWAAKSAAAGVNVPLAQATPDQQNEVAYKTLATWKQQHPDWNVGNFASAWNAGEGAPDAYQQNNVGTNSKGVNYNTPAYAQKVATAYQQFKSQRSGGVVGGPDVQQPAQPAQSGSFLGDISKTASDTGEGVSSALSKTLTGEINPLSGLIQGAGAIAGGLGGALNNVLEHTPILGSAYKGIEGVIGQGASALANTPVGQSAIQGYQQFSQAHPEIAGDIGGALNIASVLPIGEGLSVLKGGATDAVENAVKGSATKAAEDELKANLTAKGTKGVIKAGNRGIDPIKTLVTNKEYLR